MSLEIEGFQGEIETGTATLAEHCRDASVFEVTPRVVLYPKSIGDVVLALRYAKTQKLPLAVRAGGTCMTGGSLTDGAVLNMTRHMNKVQIDPIGRTATAEAGAMFRDIEAAAAKYGLMFAPYPSSRAQCGIGGMLGNNASGEKSIRFGATIDNVLDLEVLLADGTILHTGKMERWTGEAASPLTKAVVSLAREYAEPLSKVHGRVPKIASGYRLDRVISDEEKSVDLTPLFIGAQGTLGIILSSRLKLVPIPRHTQLLLVSIDSLNDLPRILLEIKRHNPEAVETFDRNTFEYAKPYFAKEALLLEPLFSEKTSLLVLAQFGEETEGKTERRRDECLAALVDLPVRKADHALSDAAWTIRRSSYTILQKAGSGSLRAVPCIEDIIVPVEAFSELVPKLKKILAKYDLSYGYHGHIGDGSLRVIPMIDLAKPDAAETIISLSREVFMLVKKLGGVMSADHSDGIVRSPFLREMYGRDLFGAFVKIKNLFDPEGVFNPKKKTGGSEAELKARLRITWS